MEHESLFEGLETPEKPLTKAQPLGEARLETANRGQSLLSALCLNDLIPPDHRARAFWTLIESSDMAPFERQIRSRVGSVGRAATDPRVLLCLWLYATSEGIGSARHLARLCERDGPYQWIAGGLTPNHHTSSDFRVEHGVALDEFLTTLLAGLMRSGVVELHRTAQDGVRVRAKASAASFRRDASLTKALDEARKRVRETKADLDAPARDESEQKRAAHHRAAKEREERVKRALEVVELLREGSQKDKAPEQVRASTTDPEARVMRMADGGYRPAVNVQVVVDTKTRLIADVGVTDSGSDLNQMNEALTRVERRTDCLPKEHLADGGYSKKQQIEDAAERGVTVYSPPTKSPKGGAAPPRRGDGPGVAEWRERMQTAQAKETYKERAATIETVFADWRQWRGPSGNRSKAASRGRVKTGQWRRRSGQAEVYLPTAPWRKGLGARESASGSARGQFVIGTPGPGGDSWGRGGSVEASRRL